MMFAARGLLVSLAFFGTVYCALSLLVVIAGRGVKHIRQATLVNFANLLFGLRIFPFALSAAITLFFAFPSFWLMERASPDEDGGTFILALCSLCILVAGLFRVLKTQARTSRAVQQWLASATNISPDAHTPMLSALQGAPPLILVGIGRPRVMISDAAVAVLSEGEMEVAVRHEISHARSWDNLKKVLISFTPFPGMGGLEKAWREAAELAADGRAVTNRQEALDLAAALIKLSRSSQQWHRPILATGLVSGVSSINLRVDRLLKWRMAGRPSRPGWPWALPVLLAVIACIISKYFAALVLAHRLTELLVP
jgi:beta-lactamase regulating signal transducer with metallopeptidase domain